MRLCVHAIVRMLMCVVSRPTGSPAGVMGERDKGKLQLSLSLPCRAVGVGRIAEGEGRTTMTCLRIQDSVQHNPLPTWQQGFQRLHPSLLFQWYNCTSLLPGRASQDLLLQQLQGFVPFPHLQVGRKTSHLRGTKRFGCHIPPQGCSTLMCQRRQTGKGIREMIAA